jgi:hypothetical protein
MKFYDYGSCHTYEGPGANAKCIDCGTSITYCYEIACSRKKKREVETKFTPMAPDQRQIPDQMTEQPQLAETASPSIKYHRFPVEIGNTRIDSERRCRHCGLKAKNEHKKPECKRGRTEAEIREAIEARTVGGHVDDGRGPPMLREPPCPVGRTVRDLRRQLQQSPQGRRRSNRLRFLHAVHQGQPALGRPSPRRGAGEGDRLPGTRLTDGVRQPGGLDDRAAPRWQEGPQARSSWRWSPAGMRWSTP